MTLNRQRASFLLLAGLLACLIGLSFAPLAAKVRFGLEFRGGYEIYYVVAPLAGKQALSQQDLIATVDVLRKRADSIGMSEPDIRIEGSNHIRVKLAGLTSADESRSLLGAAQGLPTKLSEKYTQTVGSVLGTSALKETVIAGLIGIACIFLLLIGLYRASGLLAALCTLVYLWSLMLLFNATHAVLSLSAVVAFVLGIGMAADASIICFERLREELGQGRDLRAAIRQGFSASLPTIRDANLVTALAMLALFAAGIGPIQGFALTMLASIVIGLASNFLLLRGLLLLLADCSWLSQRWLIGNAKPAKAAKRAFNFVALGKVAFLGALLCIASGAVYYRAHGLNLDIDFTAGTALDIDLDRGIDQDRATRIMADAGTVPATLAVGGARNEHIAARFDEVLKPGELKAIISAFQRQYQKVEYEENTADPGVARAFASHALYAMLAAFASILIYIGLRFSWSVALAATLPIVLDILLVSALFALFKLEIDVTYVAAMLTIIGYSLNDKIVIFGRIKENLGQAGAATQPLSALVNRSVGQTLGRSIYTVLTVVLAAACLYLFACEPLQMFSLALVIGLLSSALSSIFMATSLWCALRARHAQGQAEQTLFPRAFLAGLGAIALLGVAGWATLPAVQGHAAQAQAAVHGAPGLGDLSAFRRIGSDTLALVASGDLSAARKRITDLETAWDQAEETLKPRNPEDWTSLDKSIDRALAQLRSGKPDANACKDALDTLLAKIDSKQPALAQPLSAATQPGSLGDLSAFRGIAVDTRGLLEKGDLAAARKRITDLETAWDQAEESLKPLNTADWFSVDKSIDRALAQLRSGTPDPGASSAALDTLIAKLDSKSQH
ncbi:protein translocase subunit SecF [Pseudomonas panipatensis]|uniref:Protein-export membrane protein SecF n=1 Tax=Pseudomonas panipatensis TaxID=428992 RepID=A0A1G8IIS6_9PSED|nr:protein translocase subunit SecF [Pseudomonas panipatensis]SDI18836.1 protein-export membrane protein SecF/protein-export membrane protein SecD [Pseudomonas panipatensis]SMP73799.1 protein-export membrane protein SecF/protein-export membrane protein SecD [Pseudomonas panipatensis]